MSIIPKNQLKINPWLKPSQALSSARPKGTAALRAICNDARHHRRASFQYSTIFQSFLQGLPATSIKLGTAQTITVGSNTWVNQDATFQFKGSAYDGSQFALSHHGNAFFIVVLAPHTDSTTVGTTYFAPMIESLTFLK